MDQNALEDTRAAPLLMATRAPGSWQAASSSPTPPLGIHLARRTRSRRTSAGTAPSTQSLRRSPSPRSLPAAWCSRVASWSTSGGAGGVLRGHRGRDPHAQRLADPGRREHPAGRRDPRDLCLDHHAGPQPPEVGLGVSRHVGALRGQRLHVRAERGSTFEQLSHLVVDGVDPSAQRGDRVGAEPCHLDVRFALLVA